MRVLPECPGGPPWILPVVRSTGLDVATSDLQIDGALGLNSAWYAAILLTH